MKCGAIDPQCEREAVKAVKMTRGGKSKIQHLCQEHYAIVSDGVPLPYRVTLEDPFLRAFPNSLFAKEPKVIYTVEDAEMPQEDTK